MPLEGLPLSPPITTELEIERVGLMGQGVAQDPEGNIYFVPGAVPGDRVEVRVPRTARRYRDAELVRVIRPSPDRREPACAYFQRCGGCDWLHWDYAAQLRAKDGILEHVLSRADLRPADFAPIVGAERPQGYRNRIQVRRRGAELGFLRKRSQDLVDVESCWIADPRINAEMSRIRQEPVSEHSIKIELSVGEDGGVTRLINRPHAAHGFAQVNVAQNERLREQVLSQIRAAGSRRVLELFCGNGNFTLPLARVVEQIVAVDGSAAALQDAKARRSAEDERRIFFLQAMVDRRLVKKLPPGFAEEYDTLLLDPPRTGAGTDLSHFVHPGLKSIIYISCSPVTFSQDVQALKKQFALSWVRAVDMFPHTRHIEFVARFDRCR
jgi:23S rRNA (uracil1939-C5)-methyltransferase